VAWLLQDVTTSPHTMNVTRHRAIASPFADKISFKGNVYAQAYTFNKNLAIANRSRVSCAHNTSRASIVTP